MAYAPTYQRCTGIYPARTISSPASHDEIASPPFHAADRAPKSETRLRGLITLPIVLDSIGHEMLVPIVRLVYMTAAIGKPERPQPMRSATGTEIERSSATTKSGGIRRAISGAASEIIPPISELIEKS